MAGTENVQPDRPELKRIVAVVGEVDIEVEQLVVLPANDGDRLGKQCHREHHHPTSMDEMFDISLW